jgi:hypothetical protein
MKYERLIMKLYSVVSSVLLASSLALAGKDGSAIDTALEQSKVALFKRLLKKEIRQTESVDVLKAKLENLHTASQERVEHIKQNVTLTSSFSDAAKFVLGTSLALVTGLVGYNYYQ